MSKRSIAALLTAALCLELLTSCSGVGAPVQQTAPEMTLPPAVSSHVAPIGDAALEYTAPATLYLPRHDGTHLATLTQDVAFSSARLDAESVVRALLAHEGTGTLSSLGGGVRLALYGVNPVEVSNGVATVNLAASALQLDRKDFYVVCQAITNTLCRLGGVSNATFLVMDRQIGLDLASTLPMGALQRSFAEDIGAAYEQELTQRVEAGENSADKRLTSSVTIYYPLAGVDGIMPEVRSIAFTGQEPADMVVRILQELSNGSSLAGLSPTLSILADLLTAPPTVSEPTDGSGKVVSLSFEYSLDDMLSAMGVSRAACMGALCYTLCSYLPDVTGLRVSIGGEAVEQVLLDDGSTLTFENGVQRRSKYAPLLLDLCTLYLADEQGARLAEVRRPIPYNQVSSPRALIAELMKGSQSFDSVASTPVLPVGALKDADILGLSYSDGTLVVNLSRNFETLGAQLNEQTDALLAYSLVNTLCGIPHVRKVCFFVAGGTPPQFTSSVYWAGDFLPNYGAVAR